MLLCYIFIKSVSYSSRKNKILCCSLKARHACGASESAVFPVTGRGRARGQEKQPAGQSGPAASVPRRPARGGGGGAPGWGRQAARTALPRPWAWQRAGPGPRPSSLVPACDRCGGRGSSALPPRATAPPDLPSRRRHSGSPCSSPPGPFLSAPFVTESLNLWRGLRPLRRGVRQDIGGPEAPALWEPLPGCPRQG